MLDWTAIDTVLLDMDGTLLDLKFDNDFFSTYLPQRMQETHGMTREQALAAVNRMDKSTKGQLDWYCTDLWSAELDIDIVALKHEVADRITIKHDTAAFLKWLCDAQLDVRLVTNAHPDVLKVKSDNTGLERYIPSTNMLCSHELGYAKEAAAFWQAYVAHAPFDPHRTVLIDDNITVLQTAKDFGVNFLLAPSKPDSSAGTIDARGFTTFEFFEQLTNAPDSEQTA